MQQEEEEGGRGSEVEPAPAGKLATALLSCLPQSPACHTPLFISSPYPASPHCPCPFSPVHFVVCHLPNLSAFVKVKTS